MTRTQINIRIPEETKESWEEAIEESIEYNNVTHLIELSVRNELEGRSGGRLAGGTTGTPEVSNGEILDAVNSIRDRVDALESRVAHSEEEAPMPAVLIDPVLDNIPNQEEAAIGSNTLADKLSFGNASEIERLLGTLTGRGLVKTTEIAGKTMFYKDNE